MMTARTTPDQQTAKFETATTVTAIAVIHLVETADTADETRANAVALTFLIKPAHLQPTEGVKAHLVTVGEPRQLPGTEVVPLPAREIVDAPRLIRRIEGTRLPQRQAESQIHLQTNSYYLLPYRIRRMTLHLTYYSLMSYQPQER